MITSNRSPDQWIVPAGGVEVGEDNQDAANREILEEVSDLPTNTWPLSKINVSRGNQFSLDSNITSKARHKSLDLWEAHSFEKALDLEAQVHGQVCAQVCVQVSRKYAREYAPKCAHKCARKYARKYARGYAPKNAHKYARKYARTYACKYDSSTRLELARKLPYTRR